ncbi:galactoside alpha-(1,2)-fucosyltransferase 2-like [Watersipora subatra]|uniref:galactoside alpha-(1,2)-fucosyltransferase 2-like n=1 Tax=Watersipora subatra TaxID=2589382 RepID=UPI00355C2E58
MGGVMIACWNCLASIESALSSINWKVLKEGRVQKGCMLFIIIFLLLCTILYYTDFRITNTPSLLCDCRRTSNSYMCRKLCKTSQMSNGSVNSVDYTLMLTSTPTSVKPTFNRSRKIKPQNDKLTMTTQSQRVTVRTTTTGPKVVYNMDACKGCLAGKVLIAVQKGWICGGTRLGNKMSMMAAAIGAAAAHKMTYVLVKKDEDCGWIGLLQDLFVRFNETVPVLPYSMMKNWENLGESSFTNYDPIPLKKNNFTIAGYRQTWKYFSSKAQRTAVRDAFQFTKKYRTYAIAKLTEAQQAFPNITKPILIGLHMRIGDLVGNSYGYQMANKTYYDHVLQLVKKTYFDDSPNIIFIAASDTPKLGKQMLQDAQLLYNIFWLNGSAFEDFATLSSCHHSIMSGGTYGFWTSWLTPGLTFYFNNFAKPGSPFSRGFSNKNFHVPSWIAVSWS